MVKGDTAISAEELQSNDARLFHGWDRTRSTGEAFSRMLGLKGTAWDVYLVYGPDAQWEGELPPAPLVWMHQLSRDPGADPKLHLDAAKLERIIRKAIATKEAVGSK